MTATSKVSSRNLHEDLFNQRSNHIERRDSSLPLGMTHLS